MKRCGREAHLQFDVVAHSGRAEEIDQIHPRGQAVFLILFLPLFQVLGPQPALARAGREPQLQAKGFGLEFLHHDPGHAQNFAALSAVGGAQAQFPGAGGGCFLQGER